MQPSGSKSYVAIAAHSVRQASLQTIGVVGPLTIDEARDKARKVIKAVNEGLDRAGPQSFASISEQWLKCHVDAKGLAHCRSDTART